MAGLFHSVLGTPSWRAHLAPAEELRAFLASLGHEQSWLAITQYANGHDAGEADVSLIHAHNLSDHLHAEGNPPRYSRLG